MKAKAQDATLNKIKKKFGSYSTFCRSAGIDRYEFQKLIAKKTWDKETIKEYTILCKATELKAGKNDIDAEKLKKLQGAIKDFGGVAPLCKLPEFEGINSRRFYDVVNGFSVRNSPLIFKLYDYFKIA